MDTKLFTGSWQNVGKMWGTLHWCHPGLWGDLLTSIPWPVFGKISEFFSSDVYFHVSYFKFRTAFDEKIHPRAQNLVFKWFILIFARLMSRHDNWHKFNEKNPQNITVFIKKDNKIIFSILDDIWVVWSVFCDLYRFFSTSFRKCLKILYWRCCEYF